MTQDRRLDAREPLLQLGVVNVGTLCGQLLHSAVVDLHDGFERAWRVLKQLLVRAGFDDRDDGLGVFEDPADLALRRRIVDRDGSRAGSQMAKSKSVHSYRVAERSATRSPACTPAAMRPFATPVTCSANSLAVTSTQPSPLGRENTVKSGVRSACAKTVCTTDSLSEMVNWALALYSLTGCHLRWSAIRC